MSSKGIMRRARRLYFASLLALIVPAVFAQTPPARNRDDLDVTMHVIVDPDAKVPDEIVRRIPLPKPAQPATGTRPSGQTRAIGQTERIRRKPATSLAAQGQKRASEAHARVANSVSRFPRRRNSAPKKHAKTTKSQASETTQATEAPRRRPAARRTPGG